MKFKKMAALNCNQTGALSFGSTVVISVLLTLCYTLDTWEVVTYNSTLVQNLIEAGGLDISVHSGYYIITLNSTVRVNNVEVPERVVLIESMKGGMWKSCSVTNDEMDNLVENTDGLNWATNTCTLYEPIGTSSYTYASGGYLRHMMTRTAQSCMIVSSICVFATLTLGAVSLIIKHVILSMIASTVCAASASYQLLSMALMIKRQREAKQHLEVTSIPINLEDSMDISLGTSAYLSIACLFLGIASVGLWVIHSKTLRGAIKLYIAETKYNLICRM